LGAAAQAGFDVVELFEPDLIGCPLPPAEVRARAESLDLRVALYQPFRDFEAVPPPLLARNLRRAESKFDVMEELGAPSPPRPPWSVTRSQSSPLRPNRRRKSSVSSRRSGCVS
jgi:sugar phosphate isomerase/epimerase